MADFQPCPDEGCLGVIGSDGRCTICGALEDDPLAGDGPEGRVPCSDGSCIGLIGPDGRCSECGSRAHGASGGGPMRSPAPVDEREPCPDGGCIGLIGPDGQCIECGAGRGASDGSHDETGEEEEIDSRWARSDGEDEGHDGEGDLFDDDERNPCPDGACIGIIGSDGRCTECGRRQS